MECQLVQSLWRQYGDFSEAENIFIIPFLAIYSKEIKSAFEKTVCNITFIAAQFMIAKRLSHSRWPLTGDQKGRICVYI